nr:MAG TPA: hypothetical protein [Caudoviricetes sp.]
MYSVPQSRSGIHARQTPTNVNNINQASIPNQQTIATPNSFQAA